MDAAHEACETWRELVSARLDDATTPEEDAALDAHLDACADCAGFAAQAERVHRAFRLRPAEAVPDRHEQVLAAVEPAWTSLVAWRHRRRVLTSVAAVTLTVVLAAGAVAGARAVQERDPDRPARIVVGDAWLSPADAGGVSSLWLTLRNDGGSDDALVDVRTPVAGRADLHAVRDDEGRLQMRSVDEFPLVSGRDRALAPEASHVMLVDTTEPLVPGEEVQVELRFAESEPRTVTAVVLPDGALPPAG